MTVYPTKFRFFKYDTRLCDTAADSSAVSRTICYNDNTLQVATTLLSGFDAFAGHKAVDGCVRLHVSVLCFADTATLRIPTGEMQVSFDKSVNSMLSFFISLK